MNLNKKVRGYWERAACGTSPDLIGSLRTGTPEWFRQVERARYQLEPFIHSVAKFTLHHGKKILEIGVGAGTDHLQWARAGCQCYGVDLTDTAIETARAHLSLYGFQSDLHRLDAEQLPFEDDTFDLVYSWGVIHHTEHPDRMINEIKRVLKPGGIFIGMMYGRHSLVAFKLWIKYGLFKANPLRPWKDIIWNHMESIGTKAYTVAELKRMFGSFSIFMASPIITPYDKRRWPRFLSQFFPDKWGWFIALEAIK
jgi:SAM-dependent methyltransferase